MNEVNDNPAVGSLPESLLSYGQVIDAVDGIHVLGYGDFCFTSVQTDSRAVTEKTLFVPLIGENQDGHAYIPQAVEKGASVVFISRHNFEADGDFFVNVSKKYPDVIFIAVENTLHALQKAAGRYVEQFPDLIRIGVTGSSGKTTTKEIAAAILSQKYSVIANKGNLNSETGLPLSVFAIRPGHQVGLFEMGMNRKDEMAELAAVLKPQYAIITNIGTAHIGMLGSRQNIAAEKARVFDYLDTEGTAVIPKDDDFADFLASCVKGSIVYYGNGQQKDVQFIADHGLDGTEFSVDGRKVTLALPGIYNYNDALGAVALAKVLGLTADEIAAGIQTFKPMFGRSEVIHGAYTVIQDCYNANPDSMEKALEFVSSITTDKHRIYILGDMLELGEDSVKVHAMTGKLAVHSDADFIVFIGNEMKAGYEAAVAEHSAVKLLYVPGNSQESAKAAADAVRSFAGKEDIILIKGSRGMGLERITKILQEND